MPKVKTVRRSKNPKVVSRKTWLAARLKLLKAEKELTRRGDEVTRQRQALPQVRIDKKYQFETDEGKASLADLFRGRSQLVVYHFMFGPGYTAGCPACSATADSFNGVLPHLEARDVTMICISRAPLKKLLAYRRRMGWSFNWASSHESDFNFDFGVSAAEPPNEVTPLIESNEVAAFRLLGDQQFRNNLPPIVAQSASATGTDVAGYFSEGHGFSVFAREGNSVYLCYSTYTRGTEFLMGYYAILDRTPKGRDEGGPMGTWLHRHDEYDKGVSQACCT
jgi:predicted dithiol-disulfide oxidoreductase (DUF899 family)